MFAKSHALAPDINGLLIQDAAPDPAYRGNKGWIPTSGGIPIYPGYVFVWHATVGHWVSRHPLGPEDPRPQMYVGSLSDLATFDGGDIGAPGIASGPMWEQFTPLTGRVPIGVGLIPGSTPPITTALNDTGGEAQHVLTGAEGAVADHTHPIGVCDPASDDGFFPIEAVETTPNWTGHYITGSGSTPATAETTANLFTLEANNGNGVTSDAHNNLQPYLAVYWIRRTGRIFYVIG